MVKHTLITKGCYYASIAVSTALLFASCNGSLNSAVLPPPADNAPPVVQPLKFSAPKKLAWADVKATPAHPTVTRLAWDQLPEQPEDTSGYKAFKFPVQEAKFDFSSLPAKALDIDKLPLHALKFKTYALPAPKLITGIKPGVRNGHLYLLAVGSEQTASATSATRVLHDKDGFLWIACSEGIYRYDGENLLLFLSFPDEHLDFGMIQDSEGNLWLPDPNGPLAVLEPKAGILKKYLPNQDVDGLQHLMVAGQQIWATCQTNQVKIIDTKTQTVKTLDNKSGLAAANRTAGVAMDKYGKIWISTGGGGINIIDPAHKAIKYLDQTHGLASNRVNNIVFDGGGRLWIGMYGGLIQVIDGQKNSVQTIGEIRSAADNVLVACLAEDGYGRVWIGTTAGGVTAIDLEKRLAKHINTNDGLAADRVLDIRPDNMGQVWIATARGLNMITDDAGALERSGNSAVNNLMEDRRGLIWQAGNHGIDIVDRKKHTSRHLGVKQGLGNDTAYFVEEKNGSFFISTEASMDIVDTLKKTITHFKSNYSNILFDKAGCIYFLDHAERGINLYDPKSQTLKYFDKATLGTDDNIFFLCLDTLGRIWYSNGSGEVKVIDPGTGTIQSLTNLQREKKDTWVHFLPDSRGNMWIGTGKGIYIADIKNQKLVYFSVAQGLINSKVTSMVQHGASVYAGTPQGITIITPPAGDISATKSWRSVSYGLTKQNPVNYNADLVTRDGTYWLGDAGATAIKLNGHISSRSVPYITGISVYDRPLYFFDRKTFQPASSDTLWQAGGETRLPQDATPVNTSYAFRSGFRWDTVAGPGNMPAGLEIPYNQNFLHFHYSDVNLAPHEITRYRYILNGFDKTWSEATSDTTSLNYMNLPPGSYSFEVISTNADNTWSRPAVFSFTVDPPWWKTWWAYIVYMLLIAGAIGGFVRYRSLQLIKEKRALENEVRLATQEIIQQKEEIAAQRDSLETQRNDLEKTVVELKATQTQLIQSEKMASLGELTAGIAHEIQNPLNFVNNFSEVSIELLDELKAESEKPKAEREDQLEMELINDLTQNLEKIRHHGKRADGIVKGMLEHSRASTGQKELTDINKLVDEYLRLAYHGLRAKDKSFNAELTTHFDEKLPKANVISQDMGRVMLNLFNNAFYAVNQKKKIAETDYKPEVTVTTSVENGQIVIKVKDNGVGIPDAIKEKIMQPFFTTKPTGEGTGLGLSLTYDMVVKGHGGSIKVESIEGQGSEFILKLLVLK